MTRNTNKQIDYFNIDGPIVACVGQYAFNGMFKLNPISNTWSLLDPSSLSYDSYHQSIYRTGRVEHLDALAISKLPPLLAIVQPRIAPEPNEFIRSDYPNVFSLLGQEGAERQIFAVLREDTYETCHGDGCYIYFESAYLNFEDASKAANQISNESYMRGHLRTYVIRLDQASGNIILDLENQAYDRVSTQEVLRFLEAKFSPSPLSP